MAYARSQGIQHLPLEAWAVVLENEGMKLYEHIHVFMVPEGVEEIYAHGGKAAQQQVESLWVVVMD